MKCAARLPDARTRQGAIQLLSAAAGFSNWSDAVFSSLFQTLIAFALKFIILIVCIGDACLGTVQVSEGAHRGTTSHGSRASGIDVEC